MDGDGEATDRQGRFRRPPASLRDSVRSHPTRVAILALLVEDRGLELTAADLRGKLPGDRNLAAVDYHLRVLHRFGLVHVRAGGADRLYELA